MGEVYSHLSEEERRVIRIEIGNGTIICGIVLMLGRNASTVGREIKRDTWFPSNENESYRPYRPKRLKTGPWTGGLFLVKSVFRVSSLVFFGFRHEECRPVVCFTGCPSCRT